MQTTWSGSVGRRRLPSGERESAKIVVRSVESRTVFIFRRFGDGHFETNSRRNRTTVAATTTIQVEYKRFVFYLNIFDISKQNQKWISKRVFILPRSRFANKMPFFCPRTIVAALCIDRVIYPCRVLCRPAIGDRGSTPVIPGNWVDVGVEYDVRKRGGGRRLCVLPNSTYRCVQGAAFSPDGGNSRLDSSLTTQSRDGYARFQPVKFIKCLHYNLYAFTPSVRTTVSWIMFIWKGKLCFFYFEFFRLHR